MKNHRLQKDTAILMVCDIQQKFLPLIHGKDAIQEAASLMVQAAKVMQIPIIVTEHVSKTFGNTINSISKHLTEDDKIIPKTKFSMISKQTNQILDSHANRKQIILCGTETHVCILQTFLDLKQKGYEIFLLVDAISSIRSWQRKIAFRRLQKQNAILTTFQSAVFDLLKDSKDEKFKPILKIIKSTHRLYPIDDI